MNLLGTLWKRKNSASYYRVSEELKNISLTLQDGCSSDPFNVVVKDRVELEKHFDPCVMTRLQLDRNKEYLEKQRLQEVQRLTEEIEQELKKLKEYISKGIQSLPEWCRDEKATKEKSMFFYSYQDRAALTAIYPESSRIIYPALGLAGEAGEVANKIKKVLRDHQGNVPEEMKQDLKKELGDVLWYVAALATDLHLDLDEIAEENLQKLESRQERGVLGGSGDNR